MPFAPNFDWCITKAVSGPRPAAPEGSQTLANASGSSSLIARLSSQRARLPSFLVSGRMTWRWQERPGRFDGEPGRESSIGHLHEAMPDFRNGKVRTNGAGGDVCVRITAIAGPCAWPWKIAAPTSSRRFQPGRRTCAAAYRVKQMRIHLYAQHGRQIRHHFQPC